MRRLLPLLFGCAVWVAGTAPTASQGDVIVPADRVVNAVNVREAPTTASALVGQLPRGQQALLLVDVPSWYKVRLSNGIEGFVSKAWTTRITAPAPPSPPAAGSDIPFTIHFLDVGTGDSAIVDMGDREIIIDGGNAPTVLRNYVRDRNIIDGPVELVVVTHGDTDHWKGLNRLMNFDGNGPNPPQVREFWEPGYDRDCNPPSDGGRQGYLTFIDRFRNLGGVQFRRPLAQFHAPADQTGMIQPFTVASLPGVTFTVLHSAAMPVSDNTECSYLINNASIVMKLQIGGSSILFTGDANGKERDETNANLVGHVEAGLLQLEAKFPGTLKTDVLKVPHHGSETANTIPFIQTTDPQFVIISASTTHHLPKETVVHRYETPTRVILRTDDHHPNNEDHILCIKDVGVPLDCNYENVFIE
jgi:beta-lactamase superfamily II metal-dependent hydrolase